MQQWRLTRKSWRRDLAAGAAPFSGRQPTPYFVRKKPASKGRMANGTSPAIYRQRQSILALNNACRLPLLPEDADFWLFLRLYLTFW
jgi:hypothetical protein